MSVRAFGPRGLSFILKTLAVEIGGKTRRDRTAESGQGGPDKSPGQEQALDRKGVQEFVLLRPHCCLFLCFPHSAPFDCPFDESNWTPEEVFDPPSAQHLLFLSVRLCHGLSFFVHSLRPSLRCSYFNWRLELSFIDNVRTFFSSIYVIKCDVIIQV